MKQLNLPRFNFSVGTKHKNEKYDPSNPPSPPDIEKLAAALKDEMAVVEHNIDEITRFALAIDRLMAQIISMYFMPEQRYRYHLM